MILRHIYERSIAQSAYLVGCAQTGEAVVIDPHVDIERYIEAARAEGLRIAAVAETHIHADYVSGARALAEATDATLYVSGEGGPEWQYTFAGEPHVRVLHDGDVFEIGRIRLQAVHTPGHTPEHLIYLVTDGAAGDHPLGAFTGDLLFVGDIGRPDLLERAAGLKGTMEAGARTLFASLRRLDALRDHLVIWPGHGSGSACGKSLGGVPVSSLGYERLTNWGLRERDEAAFVEAVLSGQPEPPMYFGEMKRVNKYGEPAWTGAAFPELDDRHVGAALDAGELVVDVRTTTGSEPTLPGALVVPFGANFATWAGSVVPAATKLLLLADDAARAREAARVLAIVGRRDVAGWIAPATFTAWQRSGGRVDEPAVVDTIEPGDLPLDVRSGTEWDAGHIENARHAPLARLSEYAADLDRDASIVVYCQSGARATVAASALRRMGFRRVATLRGGYEAFERAA